MKNKDFYDLSKIECLVNHKINGCGKIIPNVLKVKLTYEGETIRKTEETSEPLWKHVLKWAEKEKE